MLTLPDTSKPVALLPVGGQPDARLHVYDGLPDDQDWLGTAASQARICGTLLSTRGLEQFSHEPLGAPIGPDDSRSVRVARATGLVVQQRAGEPQLEGIALAQGCCHAQWDRSEEGDMLAIGFQWPSAFGWGAGKDSLAQEHLLVRCLRQYEAQAESLLAGVSDAELAHGVFVTFEGAWDESTQLIQRRLAKACVAYWMSLRLAQQEEEPEQLLAA